MSEIAPFNLPWNCDEQEENDKCLWHTLKKVSTNVL